jgi:hypothetical protein
VVNCYSEGDVGLVIMMIKRNNLEVVKAILQTKTNHNTKY